MYAKKRLDQIRAGKIRELKRKPLCIGDFKVTKPSFFVKFDRKSGQWKIVD